MMERLKNIITLNKDFKSSINLFLNFNNNEKIKSYIPTNSSVRILNDYLNNIDKNKENSTLLIGPYGKGKSHLLLVLLTIISMERTEENTKIINELNERIKDTSLDTYELINKIWNKKRMLPIIISGNTTDLNQAFLFALNDALKKFNVSNIAPDTYYTLALKRIAEWEAKFPDTLKAFKKELKNENIIFDDLKVDLANYEAKAIEDFKNIYPRVTSGSYFNPMAMSNVLQLYKEINEKLCEKYDFEGIYIVFDEFSKFIEAQDGTSSGANMKLLQDICELANDSKECKMFITMVAHKSIKEYGKYLSQEIINSFTGIEGRIEEKFFITSSKNNYELIKNAIQKEDGFEELIPELYDYFTKQNIEKMYQLPFFNSEFSYEDFEKIIVKGCFPLLPVTAYLLLNISEKVAQNERTLFTFLSNDEPKSLVELIETNKNPNHWHVGAGAIYDYFSSLFKKEIGNEKIHNEWLNAEYAISKCETEEEKEIIKALALILIVNKEDELPALSTYVSLAVDIEDANAIIENLIERKILYKKASTSQLMCKTRTGRALRNEIRKIKDFRGEDVEYSKIFTLVNPQKYIVPRKYNVDYKMTRFFKQLYLDVSVFLNLNDTSALIDENNDGIVIYLYSTESIKHAEIEKKIEQLQSQKIIVICPKANFGGVKTARELSALLELRNKLKQGEEEEMIKKELLLLEEDLTIHIENELQKYYSFSNGARIIFFDGNKVQIEKKKSIDNIVDESCGRIYNKTPIINNEMINKRNISTTQTKRARLNIITNLINHTDDESFYNGTSQEATIYRALLVNSGIKSKEYLTNFENIIRIINNFIDSCSDNKNELEKMINELVKEPYGIRNGVIPIYLAYVLSIRNEDIVVYFSGLEIQLTADIVVKMCEHPKDYQLFVSKSDVEKEKYISNLTEIFGVEHGVNLTDNRIKNIYLCMQRWYRALPQVTRNCIGELEELTDPSLKKKIKNIKKLMQQVEGNPYEIIIEKLPNRLKQDNYDNTYSVLKEIKNKFDSFYDELLNLIVHEIKDIVGDNDSLYHTFTEWYERQSEVAKSGIYSTEITSLMSVVKNLKVFDDSIVAQKIIKAITNIYVEDWNTDSLGEFKEKLIITMNQVENMQEKNVDDQIHFSIKFPNKEAIEHNVDIADESNTSLLKNIIEDQMEDFSDLSVNDRVAVLLDIVNNILGEK